MRFVHASVIALLTCLAVSPVRGEPTPEQKSTKSAGDVATLLFGNPQWAKAPPGATLTYAYSKKTAQAAFGPSFDDHIVLKLGAGEDADSRSSEVRMFFGANAKPAGPFPSDKQNPVLLLVLEENVQELSKLFKANPRYLKNAIRKAWRDDAKIVATQVNVDGKSMAGTKITVAPFVDDPEKDQMMGLENLTFTVEIADSVPGTIARMDIHAESAGKAIFDESLRFEGMKN